MIGRMPAARAGRFVDILANNAADETQSSDNVKLREQVLALPPDLAQAQVAQVLRMQIARILHLSPERTEIDRSVVEMGMDSLMGMELSLAVQENFQVRLPMMAVSEGETALSIAARIVASIRHESEVSTATNELVTSQTPTVDAKVVTALTHIESRQADAKASLLATQ
jgi:acyl carrier protein